MNFNNKLNTYIDLLECSSKELANASNLSTVVISRYRNGIREPKKNSKQLDSIIDGLYLLSQNKNKPLNKESIFFEFDNILDNNDNTLRILRSNLNKIIFTLNIRISDMAKYLNFDASYISRIKNGERNPAEPVLFTDAICKYVVHKYKSDEDLKKLSILFNCSFNTINNEISLLSKLREWFFTSNNETNIYIDDFLNKVNTFDLNQYIRNIEFDKIDISSLKSQLPLSKNYYGIEEMKQGELDFFNSAIISSNNSNIFLYDDMPIEEIRNDTEFTKKWISTLVVAIKKGIKINVIHNLDRPFNEMMLGLFSWIPIYMTGQVYPYYFNDYKDKIFNHLNYVSESGVLIGECINNNLNTGKYHFTRKKEEINYYTNKSKNLIKDANPLMIIYGKNEMKKYEAILNNDAKEQGRRHGRLSSLPIYTLSDIDIVHILEHNNVLKSDIKKIVNFANKQKAKMELILSHSDVFNEIFIVDEKEFIKDSQTLSLAGYFEDKKIVYTYDEYLNHIKKTKEFAKNNKNYSIRFNKNIIFKNIQIFIRENKWVVISKDNNPCINFIIKNPKLCNSIANFILPIKKGN